VAADREAPASRRRAASVVSALPPRIAPIAIPRTARRAPASPAPSLYQTPAAQPPAQQAHRVHAASPASTGRPRARHSVTPSLKTTAR
jgi:hypothetical protein